MITKYLDNKFTNAAIMYILFVALILVLPPFLFFKFLYSIFRHRDNNLTGKVVLITGASAGVGKHLAYEYAKKGASLAIVARRENELQKVAERALRLGAPDVLIVCADVSKVDDCKRFVDETINKFGRLDHLVNNAGIFSTLSLEDGVDAAKRSPLMDINFWGSVYPTYFALPHLKKSRGKIAVNASSTAFLHTPKTNFYNASKSALVGFYESLRVELAPEISLTIIVLGIIDSEMARGKQLSKEGDVQLNPTAVEVVNKYPVMSTGPCAKSIVEGVCRGERYLTEPKMVNVLSMVKLLCPELIEWYYRRYAIHDFSGFSGNTGN